MQRKGKGSPIAGPDGTRLSGSGNATESVLQDSLVDEEWQLHDTGLRPELSSEEPFGFVLGCIGGDNPMRARLLDALMLLGSTNLPWAQPFRTVDAPSDKVLALQMRISAGDRMAALLPAPLHSSRLLAELAARPAPPRLVAAMTSAVAAAGTAGAVPFEAVLHLLDLVQTMWMLCVCRRVLVVCEGERDAALWDHLLTAEMLTRALPGPFGERHLADLLLVHVVAWPGAACTARVRRAAELAFVASPWAPAWARGASGAESQRPARVEVACVPEGAQRRDLDSLLLPALGGAAQAPPPSDPAPSEAAWLQGAQAAWEAAARSPDLAEYYARLERTALRGAAGWRLHSR